MKRPVAFLILTSLPSLVHPEEKKRTLADLLFGDVTQLLPAHARMMQTNNPGFFYLWR